MKPLPFLLILIACIPIAAQTRPADSPAVRDAISSAFAKKDRASVVAVLESALAKYKNPPDRAGLLVALAEFEERTGHPDLAVDYYQKAAVADPAARNDWLLLDAARCALSSNDIARADSLVRSVLLSCFKEEILLRARVYSVWILLASGERESALGLIRSYSAISAYAAYTPALLFTLWWAEQDPAAGKRLVESWPGSPEAAIVRGDLRTGPSPFWYLMSRNGEKVASFAREASAALSEKMGVDEKAVPVSRPDNAPETGVVAPGSPVANEKTTSGERAWQQVGFFRNKEYADELVGQLKARGFKPEIRREPRPSGTVYFSVLVPEDSGGTTAARLKDSGFESFLVIEPAPKP